MGHGGYTLELSLKDSVSAGLKDMGRALSNVRELVGSLRADVSALNKESGQAVSGLDLGKLAEGAADQLEGLSKGALQELDAAFRDSGKTMADYYAERRRQAGETADMERENASEQAERMAQELEARVTQRTQALQNETDARKSMMLNIFHDLRSPLFVIGSGLDTLAAAPDALPALLPVLQERVGFVRRLTEDLFLAAKLEQKQVLLNEDRARLEALTAAVCSACQAEAAHKGVELRTDTGTPLPVWGDAVRLEQILQNLVTNAIHYTPSGGRVTVVCAAENGQACVKVTDTGCGIAPEDQSAVFDRYFHTTADKKHDSTGLGLTIAQELAHLHHGEITLQSKVGKGSIFTLRLPLLTD